MRVSKQTDSKLVVKTNEKRLLRFLGLLALVGGVAVNLYVGVSLPGLDELQPPTLFAYQQDGTPGVEGEVAAEADSAVFQFGNYIGLMLLARERLWTTLGSVAMLAGALILLGPYRPTVTTFDTKKRQVTVKQPRWFFRSKRDTCPFHNISAIRVERDRVRTKPGRCFGANLIISHSEGRPLSEDYVHYTTVFPLSEQYRYDYPTAQAVVNRVQSFLAGV